MYGRRRAGFADALAALVGGLAGGVGRGFQQGQAQRYEEQRAAKLEAARTLARGQERRDAFNASTARRLEQQGYASVPGGAERLSDIEQGLVGVDPNIKPTPLPEGQAGPPAPPVPYTNYVDGKRYLPSLTHGLPSPAEMRQRQQAEALKGAIGQGLVQQRLNRFEEFPQHVFSPDQQARYAETGELPAGGGFEKLLFGPSRTETAGAQRLQEIRTREEEQRRTEEAKAKVRAELAARTLDPKNFKTRADFVRNAIRDYRDQGGDPRFEAQYVRDLMQLFDEDAQNAPTALPGPPADLGTYGAASAQSLPTFGGKSVPRPPRPEAGIPAAPAPGGFDAARAFPQGTLGQSRIGANAAKTELTQAQAARTLQAIGLDARKVDQEDRRIEDRIRQTGYYGQSVTSADQARKAATILGKDRLDLERELGRGKLDLERLNANAERTLKEAQAWAARNPAAAGGKETPQQRLLRERIGTLEGQINKLNRLAIDADTPAKAAEYRQEAANLIPHLNALTEAMGRASAPAPAVAAPSAPAPAGGGVRTVLIGGKPVKGTREQFFNAGRRAGKSDAELEALWKTGK